MCPPLPSTFPEDRLCAWPAAWPDLHAGPESSDWLAGSLVPVGSDLPEPGPEALRRLSPPLRLPCPHAPMGPTLSAPPPPRPPPSTPPPPGRHRSIRPRGTGTGSREHRPTQALGTAGPQRPRTGWLGLGSGLAHLGASRGLFQSCRGGDAPGPLPWAGVSSSLECSTLFEHVFVMFV